MRNLLLYFVMVGQVVAVVCAFSYPRDVYADSPELLLYAHRGVHHDYTRENMDGNTCTATRIYSPEHSYIENTLPSMEAAFAYGADFVEIDIRRSSDGEIVVFHDHMLECRTEGQGLTKDYKLAYLKTLDIGYGYTADGGKTYPFRGKGVGMMPTLREVLDRFSGKGFVLDLRGKEDVIRSLAAVLESYPRQQLNNICVYSRPDYNTELVSEILPWLTCRIAHRSETKSCLTRYFLYGWTGKVPTVCRGKTLVVPDTWQTRMMWGWPEKFLRRMKSHDTKIVVYTGNPEYLRKLSGTGIYGVWTERIEVIGPSVRQNTKSN